MANIGIYKKIIFCIIIISTVSISADGGDTFSQWHAFSESEKGGELLRWLRCSAGETLSGTRCRRKMPAGIPEFYGVHGLFITLIKDKKVRGCYGAFYHRSENPGNVLKEYLYGALKNDIRHEPVNSGELGEIKIILTVAGNLRSVSDIEYVDTAVSGVVMTRSDSSKIVFVPAEIRTVDYLKRIMKAERVIQVQSFRAVTILEK